MFVLVWKTQASYSRYPGISAADLTDTIEESELRFSPIETAGIIDDDVKQMEAALAAKGLEWNDPYPNNLGRDQVGNLKILDGRISATGETPQPPPVKTPKLGEPAPSPERPAVAAAGAQVADPRTLESLTLAPAFGLTSKFAGFLGKTIAAMNRMSLESRKAYADLVELSLLTKGNIPRQVDMRTGEEIARDAPPRYEFQPGQISTSGGSPLESIAATQIKTTMSMVRGELIDQWMDLAFGGADKAPRAALTRSGSLLTDGRFGIACRQADLRRVRQMVSKAIQDNNVHDIPQVQKAAETISRDVFDKYGTRAEAAIEGFKKAAQKPDEGFFPQSGTR